MSEHQAWWRWFFYTPWRLAAAVVLLLALAGTAAALAAHQSNPRPYHGGATGAGPSATFPAAPPTQIPLPGASNAQPAGTTAAQAAVAFVKAWAGHQPSQAAWLQAMAPYSSSYLLSQMSSTTPDAVTATKVTGAAVSADTSGGNLTVMVVPTDNGTMSVKLQKLPTGWVADDIEPGAQPGQP
jgi:hypothetical protein